MSTPTQPNPAKRQRNQILSALSAQQHLLDSLIAENLQMRDALFSLASAAGLGRVPKFARLQVRADGPGGNDPDGPPATTTEEAKTPMATDDPESIGAAGPDANSGVTPAAVTDVSNGDVAVASEPLLDNLQDVTAPVAGTDSAPSGPAAHVETDVRVSQPNNDVMDPPGSTGWQNTSSAQERFVASVRLARARIAAGLSTDEDMVLAQTIAGSNMDLVEIRAEERGISAATKHSAAPTPPRHLVPRAAAVGQGRPSLAPVAASTTAASEEFLFE